MLFLRLFKHLLPDAKAWRITIDKQLRQFFEGLTVLGVEAKVFFDQIFNDLDPQKTRQLDLWDSQFALPRTNITEQQRRDRLDAAWKATGGQSPRYVQDTLQAAGFDVYVHEWWVPGGEADVNVKACATPRDPNNVLTLETGFLTYLTECGEPLAQCGEPIMECGNFALPFGYLLVNKLFVTIPDYLTLCGEPFMQCGEPAAECGDFSVFINVPITYTIPLDSAKWSYIIYIGGSTFGLPAEVNKNRRDEFEDLCLKIIPAQQWIGVIVDYIAVSTMTANVFEAGDTQVTHIVPLELFAEYDLAATDLGGNSYGSDDGTGFVPAEVFWTTGDWQNFIIGNTDILTIRTTGKETDQSEIFVTIPAFSATPIRCTIDHTDAYLSYVSSLTTGLQVWAASVVPASINYSVSVNADVNALNNNEHWFIPEQIGGIQRGYNSVTGVDGNDPGYLARMEFFDDPTRLIIDIITDNVGFLIINSDDETGAVGTSIGFELEDYNWGSPITLLWDVGNSRWQTTGQSALWVHLATIIGQLKKIRITGPT